MSSRREEQSKFGLDKQATNMRITIASSIIRIEQTSFRLTLTIGTFLINFCTRGKIFSFPLFLYHKS